MRKRTLHTIVLAGATLLACGEDTEAPPTNQDTSADVAVDAGVDAEDTLAVAPSVAETIGVTQYAGAITPIALSSDGDVTTYTFDEAEGPLCMRGDPFRASVRDVGSDDVVIFMQGGGACWSSFCLAVTKAPEGIPDINILDPTLEANPVADWNHVYVPYCDGSFFAGDADIDDDLNGNGTRFHRGLANLTGALEAAKQHFPNPRRVLLAGSSGGAYGLLLGAPLTRHYYPEAELILMADSGIGLARDEDEAYLRTPLEEFNLLRFIPDSCEDCLVSGHITPLVSWYLERDDNLRIGLYSAWYDSVLANTFLQVPPASFAQALREQTDAIHVSYPDRFRRFITDGTQHTCLLEDASGIIGSDLGAVELPEGALQSLMGGDLVIGGLSSTVVDDVTVGAWLGGLIEGDLEVWVDTVEPAGPPPAVEE